MENDRLEIKVIYEHEITENLSIRIQKLLNEGFTDIYPKDRIYFKQIPHMRFLAFNDLNELIGHVGIDHRIMNLNGNPIRVIGIIDLCISQEHRSKGIGSKLLKEVELFFRDTKIDFILLFTENKRIYEKNGYKLVENKCKWLKIDIHSQMSKGIGDEVIEGMMIKEINSKNWNDGTLDLLGYLY